MARYISSISVVLSPKSGSDHIKSFVISLDPISGSTLFHAVEYISKNPLIKGFLNKYYILNLTFQYSTL